MPDATVGAHFELSKQSGNQRHRETCLHARLKCVRSAVGVKGKLGFRSEKLSLRNFDRRAGMVSECRGMQVIKNGW